MAKNLQKETLNAENEPSDSKKSLYTAVVGGAAVLLICLGLCISYDLHQTKIISAEILPQMQADYEAKIDSLNAEIELLQREFNKLQSEHLSVDALSEEYINEKFSEFKENIAKSLAYENNQQNNNQISALKNIVGELQQLQQEEAHMPQEILLGSGALTIRTMAENGENFAYEAEMLQIMAEGNPIAEEYIATIRKFSSAPLPTKVSLIKDFKRIYAELSGTKIKNPAPIPQVEDATDAKSWKNAFFRRLKNLVTFKHKKTVKFEPAPDEVYDLVESGNLAQALKRMETTNKYALLHCPALETWIHDAQNYLEFDGAVNGLLMNTLAHLKIKQFEHPKK